MKQIKIASYNIHKCVGIDKKFNPSRIADVIKEINPDIISLQETDKRFGNRQGLLDLNYIYKSTGLKPTPLFSTKPQSHGWHGNLLLFRHFKLTHLRQITLPKVEPRGAILAQFEINNKALLIVSAHLGLLKHTRNLQLKHILKLLEKYSAIPTILMGDFNEWRKGSQSSLRCLEKKFIISDQAIATFPAPFPILPLDRIFYNPPHLISNIEPHDSLLARKASDHLPLKADLNLAALV